MSLSHLRDHRRQRKALIGDQEVETLPGTIGILPAKVPHKITAGEEGGYFLAKLTPALV